MLAKPPLNLRERVLLRDIERVGHLRVERGGDRQRLRSVDDHFSESRRSLPNITRVPGRAHLLARVRGDPVHPTRILLRGEGTASDGLPGRVEHRVADADGVTEVVVIRTEAVGFDIAHGVGAGSPEQDHAAMHAAHFRMFLI